MALQPPALTLSHLISKKQHDDQLVLIRKHWFQWSDRRTLSALVLRIDLLDAAGAIIDNASVRMPKVKVTGHVPGDPPQPIYDSPVFIALDGPVDRQPVSFRYYTVEGVMKKSAPVTTAFTEKFEDLSMYK